MIAKQCLLSRKHTPHEWKEDAGGDPWTREPFRLLPRWCAGAEIPWTAADEAAFRAHRDCEYNPEEDDDCGASAWTLRNEADERAVIDAASERG